MANVVLFISMLGNIFLTTIKIIVGILFNSKSLVADGIHSLSDLSTDIIALLGNYFAEKPADKDHPYGHGKINYLTSLIIGILIITMGTTLLKNSFNYTPINPNITTIIVVIITIVIKIIVSRLLIYTGKKENNNILISSGKESFTDVFSSLLVLITLILGQFSAYISIFKYMDMVGSIIISIIIIFTGLRITIENFKSVIGQIELSTYKLELIKHSLKEKYDIKIRNVSLLKYGTYYQAFMKIIVDENIKTKDLYKLIESIKTDLLEGSFNIKYVHIDFDLERSDEFARITRSRNSKGNSKKKSIKSKDK